MLIKLQSTDPESLHKEEGSKSDAWIFLGRTSRIDFSGGVNSGGNMSRRGGEEIGR